MRWDKKYDLSGSDYLQDMDSKTTRYNSLIRKAMQANRDNYGKPTKEEAKFYYEASLVCEEIMSLNNSQRAIYEKWKGFKLDCEENIKRITDILAPAPVVEPAAEQIPQKVSNSKRQASAASAPSATSSGFKTIHATKEVPAEKIEKWFQPVPESGFDSVIGRTELKDRLMLAASGFGWDKVDDTLQMNPVKCYFLYGPPGTGKTHMINAFANELSKRAADSNQKPFSFMQLTGSDVHESYVGMAEKVVKTAFAVAEEHEPCLLFMDEIDNLCVRLDNKAEGHERRLTVEFMQAYNKFIKSGKQLIFMGATNHPGKVAEPMLDRCTLIPVPLPAEKDRLVFFNQMLNRTKGKDTVTKLALEADFSAEEMAASTDNHSYRDLERLRESMLEKLKGQAIREYRVLDEDGNVDQKATDEQASRAILDGQILITRAMFEQAQKENPPSDKAESRQELKEFEERISRNNG